MPMLYMTEYDLPSASLYRRQEELKSHRSSHSFVFHSIYGFAEEWIPLGVDSDGPVKQVKNLFNVRMTTATRGRLWWV